MRTLPALVTAELLKDAIMLRHLFKLVGATTRYWTDCDQNVYFAGHWWEARGITFDSTTSALETDAETISVKIDNVGDWFSDIALAENLQKKAFYIYYVALDKNLDVVGCTVEADLPIIFDGFIDAMDIDRKEAVIDVISFFVTFRVLTPRRMHLTTCWKTFKSTECAYAGAETWCDKSKSRCVTLLKTDNFGGFEYISELVDGQFYWGRRQKVWPSKR